MITSSAMAVVVRRLRPDVTVNGFRSTFRDWAAEMTNHPRELAEVVALPHTVGSAVENAYRRGDMPERRRRLMEDWAMWCGADKRPAVSSSVAKAATVKLSFQLAPLSCQALTLTASLSLGQDRMTSGNSQLPTQLRGAPARPAENVLLAT